MRKPLAAFTLIELVVVLVLMSLLATLTVTAFGGTIDRYRLSRAAETFESFDAYIRREARKSGDMEKASINSNKGELTFVHSDRLRRRMFRIPNLVEIAELKMVDSDGRRRSMRSVTDFEVASSGRTPTYAVHLQRGKLSKWLVVLGFSGQIVSLESEREVDALLSS